MGAISRQTLVVLVRTDDPWDKVTALNAELRSDNFYGEVVLKYESGVPRRLLVTENIKL